MTDQRLDAIEAWIKDSGNLMATILLNPGDPSTTLPTRFEDQGRKLDDVFNQVKEVIINVRQEAENRVQSVQEVNTQVTTALAQQVIDNGTNSTESPNARICEEEERRR